MQMANVANPEIPTVWRFEQKNKKKKEKKKKIAE